MRTIDSQSGREGSRWSSVRRDLALARRLVAMLWSYVVDGGRIRRAYRSMEARGEVYWLDGEPPP